MAKGKITVKATAALGPGETLWDSELPGFGIRRQRGAHGFYLVRYRVNGRVRQLTLGSAAVLTIPEARERARRALLAAADGRDIMAEREEAEAERAAAEAALTVAQLVTAFFDAAAAGRILTRAGRPLKPGSVEIDRRRVRNHVLPLIGDMKAASVTRKDVERVRDAIAESSGRGSSTRTLAVFSAAFSWAVEQELIENNPIRTVRVFASVPRDRRIQDHEYLALGRVLETDTADLWPGSVAAVRFLLLSGWRLSEVANLRHADIDRAGRRATLADTKTGKSSRVLSDEALKIVDEQDRRPSGFVFAVPGGNAPRALAKTFATICKRAKIEGVTPHTARHGYISVAGDLLIAREAVKALVGHADNSVTGGYTHYASATLREVANRIADSIVDRMTSARGEVIQLRERA